MSGKPECAMPAANAAAAFRPGPFRHDPDARALKLRRSVRAVELQPVYGKVAVMGHLYQGGQPRLRKRGVA